jgi:hypothetical protein
MASRYNALDQELDIAGSQTQLATMTLADEPSLLGSPVVGQTGAVGTITAASGGVTTLGGLTGMTVNSVGRFITITGAANANNNGTFLIITYNSATSVDIANATGVFPDANSGTLGWTERAPYSLLDDLNYERTDRQAIKGVPYYDPIPTYTRPTATTTPVPANLSNIAGKTTDAQAVVTNRKYEDASVNLGDGYVILTATGQLQHAGTIDRTGVPIWSGADNGNWEATYCELASELERELVVVGGPYDGYRIFGRATGGYSTSPDTVEVDFFCVQRGAPIGTAVPYVWDGYQPTQIDIYYPYRVRLDQMPETAMRVLLVNGLVSDSFTQEIDQILSTIGTTPGDTSLAGLLTNLTAYYPFYNLPNATPTVVDALNTLNEQIGNRDYTGPILTDGYTITQSLQQLANAISGATSQRYIERLGSAVAANTAHTLPGGLSYTPDGTNNGKNMWVFTRGLLRDPGPASGGNDYAETSSTQITFYSRLNTGDHINYIVYL